MSTFPAEHALRRALGPAAFSSEVADDLLTRFTAPGGPAWNTPLNPAADIQAEARVQVPGIDLGEWSRSDAARALLMFDWIRRAPGRDVVAGLAACYEQGDAAEQTSWLRALPLLPDPQRWLPWAVDACRTNIQPLFQSIACENPFPAAHFPERNFNQMILKALFNNVALARVVGLPGRRNAELARMAGDYAAERRAAGRSVPGDIGLVL
jgi:hypothetical protein